VVLRSGKPIKLTLKEFGLLEYLMRHPDKVVTRDDLIFNIWDFNSDSFSNFVDVHMNSLRNKINKSGDKSLIQTVRGVGYIINS
jgi:DNA-binding response OmpR family regulator